MDYFNNCWLNIVFQWHTGSKRKRQSWQGHHFPDARVLVQDIIFKFSEALFGGVWSVFQHCEGMHRFRVSFPLFFLTHSFPNFICSRTGQNSQQPFTHMTKEKRLSAPSQLKAWYCSPSQVKTLAFQPLQPEHLHIAISQLLNSLSKLNETVIHCVCQLPKFLVGTVWLQVMGDGVVGTQQL